MNADELYAQGIRLMRENNYSESFPFLLQSAELGCVDAQFLVGASYERELGVLKDINSAIEWYMKAAKQGNSNALNNFP